VLQRWFPSSLIWRSAMSSGGGSVTTEGAAVSVNDEIRSV
jgi:hypothetical protein